MRCLAYLKASGCEGFVCLRVPSFVHLFTVCLLVVFVFLGFDSCDGPLATSRHIFSKTCKLSEIRLQN